MWSRNSWPIFSIEAWPFCQSSEEPRASICFVVGAAIPSLSRATALGLMVLAAALADWLAAETRVLPLTSSVESRGFWGVSGTCSVLVGVWVFGMDISFLGCPAWSGVTIVCPGNPPGVAKDGESFSAGRDALRETDASTIGYDPEVYNLQYSKRVRLPVRVSKA